MSTPPGIAKDDALTIISIAALASILQDVLHEGLGHGLAAWLSGAHHITVSTVAMQADLDSRWIAAAGTVVNLIFAGLFCLLLRFAGRCRPATRLFLILALMGNLFSATGYFLFSGVFDFGDWAQVIQGLHPHWLWRFALIVFGALAYIASMFAVAAHLRPFRGIDPRPGRIWRLCMSAYLTDGILAGLAGLLNPAGIFYVFASALPSTLGANAGLFSIPGMLKRPRSGPAGYVEPIARGMPWLVAGGVLGILYIFFVGRGLSWSR